MQQVMMLGKGCSVLLLFLVFARNEAAGSKLKLARRNPGIANLAFTSNLEFVLEDPSDLNCARHCMRSPGCVTFTYSVVTKTCRGHSGVMTSSRPSFNLPDSVGFVVGKCFDCCTFLPQGNITITAQTT